MAHPKHRKSKSKNRMKRSHHALQIPNLTECPNCRNAKMPHRICPNCGYYRDAEIV
ncbi:MAG: 50S ribosomal protein L32 [Candidatus Omnitrophota bacterium]|jgi:large subunit ribosomal protein L32|nr:MAG: 50S ribosomal protein L32 [Candidatus Omnitrophota bacterium]